MVVRPAIRTSLAIKCFAETYSEAFEVTEPCAQFGLELTPDVSI